MNNETVTLNKTLEQNFADWEASVFGFGYGAGEPHILLALKEFFECVAKGFGKEPPISDTSYDYRQLESKLGALPAWLLINALCRASVLEYGSSPRFGWLTKTGEALKSFVDGKTVGQLEDICGQHTEYCSPDACNCGEGGYIEGRVCPNPFWRGH